MNQPEGQAFLPGDRCQPVRAILYAGTRGCSTTLDDALREHLDPALVVAPADPRLLGQLADAPGIEEDCQAWAQLVLDRGLGQARHTAAASRQELGQVFGQDATTQPAEIDGLVVPARLEDTLPERLAGDGVTDVWASRELLEILQTVGVDVADGLTRRGIELEVR